MDVPLLISGVLMFAVFLVMMTAAWHARYRYHTFRHTQLFLVACGIALAACVLSAIAGRIIILIPALFVLLSTGCLVACFRPSR